MVYKIIWSDKALETFVENIEFLKQTWSDKEVANFTQVVDKKLLVLSTQPDIGKPANVKGGNIRLTVLHKRLCLIYRVNTKRKTIELLLFWNTYQNPAKLK